MASPLDILGGLGLIGSQGATGAYTGEIEGMKLRKQFESQDLENQLRQAELAIRQSRQAGPLGFGPGTMVTDPTGKPLFTVPFAPRNPMNVGPGHTVLDPNTHQPIYTAPAAPTKPQQLPAQVSQAWDAYHAQNPEATFWDFYKQYAGLAHPGPQPHQSAPFVRLQTDAQGNVHQIITTLDAQGNYKTRLVPLGQIGTPQRPAGGAAGQPRETVTATDKVTQRKLLTDQETATLNASLPKIVDELSLKPGFNVPGAYITLSNGMTVRKEEVLAQYIKDRLGIEATLVWEPGSGGILGLGGSSGRFKIVKAWNPASRERVETTRRTGPPSARPTEEAADEEE